MKILKYPNITLTSLSTPVLVFDESLCALIEEMKTVMLQANGLGLAAPQVGINKQLFIMKDSKDNIIEIINPELISSEGDNLSKEGCLSAPNIYLNVHRAEYVTIKYKNMAGEEKKAVAEGLEARIIQHEMEHLMGDFYFNRVNRATRKIALAQLRKQK